MPSPRTALAALPALPAGATALVAHNALYVLAALLLCPVLAVLPTLIDVLARWRSDLPRQERERIGNQALREIGQTNPERVVELLAQLPPLAHPFEREPPTPQGPAPPPEPTAAPGDPGRRRTDGTG